MTLVLIAEPSARVRQLLEQVVTDLGHETVCLGDPSGDLACDVLILEPTWPSGRRVAERLRSRQPDLPIILVGSTKHPKLSDALTGYTRVAKPFALHDLQRALTDAAAEAEAHTDR
jgi:CheY-like chemotaxis protein